MRARTYEETLRLLLDANVPYDEADRLAREMQQQRRERWAAHAAVRRA